MIEMHCDLLNVNTNKNIRVNVKYGVVMHCVKKISKENEINF